MSTKDIRTITKENWNAKEYAEKTIEEIKQTIGDKKAICALSGGVDSAVSALMVHKAIGENLTCIFVDHGLMRKNEPDYVEKIFKETFDMNFIRVNAEERFLDKLKGVDDPEEKRKIIGDPSCDINYYFKKKLMNPMEMMANQAQMPNTMPTLRPMMNPMSIYI